MGKEKIVIDTNNLISALGWEGNSREIVRKAVDSEFSLFISLKQMSEIERVMNYPKFRFTEEQKMQFLEILMGTANIIYTGTKLDIIKDDPDDNLILECAVECDADFIITGDKHLLKLQQFRAIRVVTAREFLRMICNFNRN